MEEEEVEEEGVHRGYAMGTQSEEEEEEEKVEVCVFVSKGTCWWFYRISFL